MDTATPSMDDWRAEEDARVLAMAREIETNGTRLAKARAAAHRKAAAMAAVAATKVDDSAAGQLQNGYRKVT